MKKMFFIILSLALISACSSVQTNQQSNNEKQEEKQQVEISLRELAKNVKQNFAEISPEKLAELEKIEKNPEFQKEIKEFKESVAKYSEKEYSLQDMMFIGAAYAAGYTESEIFEYLDPSLVVIKNPYCEDEFKFFKISKTLPNVLLVNGCKETSYSSECFTQYDRKFITYKKPNEIYFDGKILKPNKDECPVYIGVLEYGFQVVPILSFEGKKITKMRSDKILKIREETAKEIK